MIDKNIILTGVITAVVASFLGYQVGTTNFRFNRPSTANSRFDARARGMQNNVGNNGAGMMGRGGAITGEVSSKDGKTLTLKLSDGSSKTIILSDTTTYRTSVESNLDKVEVGAKIAAFGTSSTDGSTVATSIELNPIQRNIKQ